MAPLVLSKNGFPCLNNPLGVKGCGEAGAVAAPPAVMNAILDALAELGVRHLDMPATPERGDTWNTEDIAPHFLEVFQVRRAGARGRVPAGRYRDAVVVRETDPGESGHDARVFAPDIGTVKVRGRGKRLRLYATTLNAGRGR